VRSGSADRAGVVVVRAWIERGVSEPRARIVEVDEIGSGREVVRTVAGIDEICVVVREFLVRFAG
jgi:hypothetical protein